MTDQFDRAQELELARLEDIQRRARLPDGLPPPEPRYCRDCGEKISRARLQLVPHARLCVGCGELAEARHRYVMRPRA